MSKLTDFIDNNLVEKDYGGYFGGVREPSLGELRRLLLLVDAAMELALQSAPPENARGHDDDG